MPPGLENCGNLVEKDWVGASPIELSAQRTKYLKWAKVCSLLIAAHDKFPHKFEKPGEPWIDKILERLKEEKPEKVAKIKFIPAGGSAFDKFHGVDGFFVFVLENEKIIPITLDFTINPQKDEYKADIIACPEDLENCEGFSKEVIRQFSQKLKWYLKQELQSETRVRIFQ